MSTTERGPLLASIERVTLQARAVGVVLEDPQVRKLLAHVELLQRWNTTYNLTAIRDPDAMWSQHVLDCLAAVPAVRRELAARHTTRARVLDVGSGGALPGAVWAVAMPEIDITCLDTVGKKVAFIRQVAGQLQLPNLKAEQARVESWRAAPFDLIACRAFASLRDFTRWTAHLLAPGGCWVAMKGRSPHDELRELMSTPRAGPAGLGALSEAEGFSNVPERHVQTPRIEAQSADVARATASICNDGPGCLGGQGGHGRKTLSLSAHIRVFHVEQLSVPGLGAERCLVWMRPAGAPD